MLCKYLKFQYTSGIEIEPSDGNVFIITLFLELLEEFIESKVDDSRGKLTQMIK